MPEPRFYLDENISPEVAHQLERMGIDAVSARDLGGLGAGDMDHLQRATQMLRVLCTQDQDFLRLAAQGVSHSGIAFGLQSRASIGGWVKGLRKLAEQVSPGEAANQVFFVAL